MAIKPNVMTSEQWDKLIHVSCEVTGVNPSLIRKRDRTKPLPETRALIIFVAWNHYGAGVTEIGRALKKNHATAHSARARFVDAVETSYEDAMAYVRVVDSLGFSVPSWLHVRTKPNPKMEWIKKKNAPTIPAEGGSYVKPINYTKRELDERKKWLRSGGEFKR